MTLEGLKKERYEQDITGSLNRNESIGDLCFWSDVQALITRVEEVVKEMRTYEGYGMECDCRGPIEKWADHLEGKE